MNDDDMTYEPVTDVTALAARVQELETALAEQCGLTAQLIEQRGELERENAELRARLDAVPVQALIRDYTGWGNRSTTVAIDVWLLALQEQERQRVQAQAVQP